MTFALPYAPFLALAIAAGAVRRDNRMGIGPEPRTLWYALTSE